VIALQNQPKAAPRPTENISRPLFQNVKVGENKRVGFRWNCCSRGSRITAIPIKETPAAGHRPEEYPGEKTFPRHPSTQCEVGAGKLQFPVFFEWFLISIIFMDTQSASGERAAGGFFEPPPAGNETPAVVNAAPVMARSRNHGRQAGNSTENRSLRRFTDGRGKQAGRIAPSDSDSPGNSGDRQTNGRKEGVFLERKKAPAPAAI